MNQTLGTLTIILSLVLAGWGLQAALRTRAPGRSHLIGLGVVEAAIIALTVATLITVAGGTGPAEAGTFWGYLITLICLPPLAGVLARMEPTRWGSAIVTVVCLVIPVLVIRLQQTWEVAGV